MSWHPGWVTLSVPPDLWVPPRFATARDPGRRTVGGAVARIAGALGRPLMPWQQHVADVGGEVDDAGRFAYPLVIVTVQRQSGKTTLDLAQSVQRCLQGPKRKVWHTAQTGQDARKKWGELAEDIMASPLRSAIAGRPRRTNGAESLEFINGSKLRPHPPTRDSLHGEQSDTNNIDEAWSFDEIQGGDLFQAITPTQATRPGAQTWIYSTRGDRSSVWFHGLLDRAYAGEPGIALFDWSIPDDADPSDLQVIAEHHPAFGHTIDMQSLERAQATLAPGEFARAFGNRATGAGERVIPLEAWSAAQTEATVPAGRAAYGLAVSRDGTAGALVAAVTDAAGVPWVEVLEHRPGRSWLVDVAVRLRDAGQGIAVDRRGPAAPVADQLELAGVDLLPLQGPDYAAGCQDIFDRITHTVPDEADPEVMVARPRIRIRSHEALDIAADIAGRRLLGDGAWVWSRTRSAGDLSTLEAATLAAWAVLRNPTPAPAPKFRFG